MPVTLSKFLDHPSRPAGTLRYHELEGFLFAAAVTEYANLGRTIGSVLSERDEAPAEPTRSEKIPRNEPCPCGSGRKYKKCCGARVH